MTAAGMPAWAKGQLISRPKAEQDKIDAGFDKLACGRLRCVILVTPAHDDFIAKLREGKTQRKAARPSMQEQKKAAMKRKAEVAEQKKREKQEQKDQKEAERELKRAKKAEEEVEKKKKALDSWMDAVVRLEPRKQKGTSTKSKTSKKT